MPQPTLRPARHDEALALARLHLRVWRETYMDMAPPEAIASLDEGVRFAQWCAALAEPAPRQTFVADAREGVVGLVSLGPPSHEVFGAAGEIRHLYVAPSHRGTGLGARLLRQGLSALTEAGYTSAGLAVVAENTAARQFYQHMGGIEGPEFTDKGPLWRSRNRVVSFDLTGV